jgi:phosphatidylserine/phosphatidylglycerophosphate/cardiolipin synthase-like enzyme
MSAEDWLLTGEERGNPHSVLSQRPWTTGNEVRPLIDGAAYFAELCAAVGRMRSGDLLMFTDWRGDPDERLDGPGSEVSRVFAQAASRGVVVKGLIWRSHTDKLQFSDQENEHLGEEIEAAGGECLRDMRVRAGGSHHQKFVVLRHPGRPELDVAFVGGIDLCHSRHDTSEHLGDPQAVAMSKPYGKRPPWHDAHVAIQGPAVADVETTFRERWTDPAPLTRHPLRRLQDAVRREDTTPGKLPERLPDPAPRGDLTVQLLRTYPYRRHGYPFAPRGERTVARGYTKAVARARTLIYLEDQYLWEPLVIDCFAQALRRNPSLRMIAVVPRYPDQEGASGTTQILGRSRAISALRAAGGDRFAAYSPENADGTPIYVHAKVCVVDDVWATVGSDNVNRRSWTYDSELTCAVWAGDGPYARDLRLRMAHEHLGDDDKRLDDPATAFEVFAESARALQEWHNGGRTGARPRGRLREYRPPKLSAWSRRTAPVTLRLFADPDGRPRDLRRTGGY